MHHQRHIALWAAPLFVAAALVETPSHAEPTDIRPALAQPPQNDKLAVAVTQVGAIESAGWSVQTDLRRAHQAHDGSRAQCLDELLTRMHVAARAGRGLREAIEAAVTREDPDGLDRLMVRLAHLRQRSNRLAAEASRCGERDIVLDHQGATIVRVIAPALPESAAAYPGHPRAQQP